MKIYINIKKHFNHQQNITNWAIDLPNEKQHPSMTKIRENKLKRAYLCNQYPIELELHNQITRDIHSMLNKYIVLAFNPNAMKC